MHFEYHPILGLQYCAPEDHPILVYDVAKVPEGYDLNEIMKLIKESGVLFINSEPGFMEVEYIGPTITSNHSALLWGEVKKEVDKGECREWV